MKKLTKILIPSLLAAASFCVPAAGTEDLFRNIVFIGDSITQANGSSTVSYRYQLWKCFVDNDVAFSPVGSMNHYAVQTSSTAAGTTTSSQISDYRGQIFNNTSEGHWNWQAPWIVSGTGTANQQYASTYPESTIDTSSGLSDWIEKYYADVPNTATLLIGINDLSKGSSFSTLLENQKAIVDVLTEKNPNVKVYVFSILPSNKLNWTTTENGTTYTTWTAPLAYNELLKNTIESGAWGGNVVYCDITTGFDPSAMSSDNLHPNAQGELIIAGNMARALGLEQRTLGLTRKGNENLSSQVSLAVNNGNAQATYSVAGTQKTATMANSTGVTASDGKLIFNTTKSNVVAFDLNLGDSTATRDITVAFSLRMNEATGTDGTNAFSVWVGNGLDEVGLLYVTESAVYWGDPANLSTSTLLYGIGNSTYADKSMTLEENAFRIVYLAASDIDGVSSGFYVWLNDQLILEGKSGMTTAGTVNSYKNSIVLGDVNSTTVQTCAEVSGLAFDFTAYAPISLIPEPSLFGVIAGTLALVFAGTRRRRGNGNDF